MRARRFHHTMMRERVTQKLWEILLKNILRHIPKRDVLGNLGVSAVSLDADVEL
tara:strand:+ start:3041 stop:3202 length:162 start_codon:yes stop_codon:yes gene_type:complete